MSQNGWTHHIVPDLEEKIRPALATMERALSESTGTLTVTLDHQRVANAAIQAGLEPHRPVEEGYLIARDGETVTITGGSVRGCLYGLFTLEDALHCDTVEELGHETLHVPWFRDRSGGILRFAQLPPPDFSDTDYAAFLTRLGINYNGLHIGETNIGAEAAEAFDLFCYGGGNTNFFFHGGMTEEEVQAQIAAFEAQEPGSVVYTNPRTHSGTVSPILSIFTPLGRRKHRESLRAELDGNHRINALLYTFGDWGAIHGEGCPHVGHLPLHKRVIAWLEVIGELAEEIRPGVRVIARTWYYPAEFIDAMIEDAPRGIGIRQKEPARIVLDKPLGWALIEDNYSDVMLNTFSLSDSYGPVYLSGGTRRGVDFYPAVGVGDTDESIDPVIGIATPRLAAKKLRRLAEHGICNLSVWWGGINPDAYSPNHAVIRACIWDPWADVEALLSRVAVRDFGELAPDLLRFWEAVESAVTDWDYVNWKQQLETFCGRNGQPLLQSITPDIVNRRTHEQRGRTGPSWYEQIRPNAARLLGTTQTAATRLIEAANPLGRLLEQPITQPVRQRIHVQVCWTELLARFLRSEFHVCEAIVLAGGDSKHGDLAHTTFEEIRKAEAENTVATIAVIRRLGRENLHLNSGAPLGLAELINQFEKKRAALLET